MPQQFRFPCGCVETIYNPMDPALMFVEMCQQHLSIVNSPGPKQPIDRILPQRGMPNMVPPNMFYNMGVRR